MVEPFLALAGLLGDPYLALVDPPLVAFQALEDHLDLVVPCLALVDQLIEVLEDPYLNQEVRL